MAKKSEHDKRMAATLKDEGVERWTSVCPICYKVIGNDTFGGRSVLEHYSRHARGYEQD